MTQSVTHGVPIVADWDKLRGDENEAAPTFRKKTVHHATQQFDLVLNAEVDKVGVYEHTIRRN
jgi:hypothetical protein